MNGWDRFTCEMIQKGTVMNLTFKVSANALRAAAPFQATKDVRFYLCRVHVEPAPQGGIYVVATNGHTLIVLHDAEGSAPIPATFTVPKGLLPAIRKTQNAVEIVGSGEENAPARMTVGCTSDACVLDTVARFPDWRRIFGEVCDEESKPFDIDPAVLAVFGTVNANYHAKPKLATGVRIRSMHGAEPAKRVDFDGKAKIPGFGVIMPWRFTLDEMFAGRVQLS